MESGRMAYKIVYIGVLSAMMTLPAAGYADETVAESVQRIAAQHQTEISPAFVDKLSTLIADFIIGGHAPQ